MAAKSRKETIDRGRDPTGTTDSRKTPIASVIIVASAAYLVLQRTLFVRHLTRASLTNLIAVLALVALGAVVFVIFARIANSPFAQREYHAFCDFGTYWMGFQVASSGGNPFDVEAVRRYAQENNLLHCGPIYPPPSVFMILLPFFVLPFPVGAALFGIANIAAVIAAAQLSLRFCSPTKAHAGTVVRAAALTFVPLTAVFKYGQFSILILLVVLCSAILYDRGRNVLPAVLLSLTVLKPHLVFVLGSGFLVHSLLNRRWRYPLALFCSGFGTLLLSELIFPGIIMQWRGAGESPLVWQGLSAASMLRMFLLPWLELSHQIMLFIACAGIAFVWGCSIAIAKSKESLLPVVPRFLAAGALAAPYFWLSDASILLPCYLSLWCMALGRAGCRSMWAARTLLLALLLGGSIHVAMEKMHYGMSWYPISIALSAFLFVRKETGQG